MVPHHSQVMSDSMRARDTRDTVIMRTKEEERIYRRQWRAARKREETAADATILTMPARPGEVEAGVKAELAGLAAAATHPGIAQAAIVVARVMDSERARAHWAAAARSLSDLLTHLHDASKGSNHPGGGKLIAMRKARDE
jgi:hypothetical protein